MIAKCEWFFFVFYVDGNFIISMPLWNKENELFYILRDGGDDGNDDNYIY